MSYKQLTEMDRTIIWSMRRAGNSQSEIARKLGCHRSTICREIARNKSLNGYDVHSAQLLAKERKRHKASKTDQEFKGLIEMLSGMGWSEEKQKDFILRHHPELEKKIDEMLEH